MNVNIPCKYLTFTQIDPQVCYICIAPSKELFTRFPSGMSNYTLETETSPMALILDTKIIGYSNKMLHNNTIQTVSSKFIN